MITDLSVKFIILRHPTKKYRFFHVAIGSQVTHTNFLNAFHRLGTDLFSDNQRLFIAIDGIIALGRFPIHFLKNFLGISFFLQKNFFLT